MKELNQLASDLGGMLPPKKETDKNKGGGFELGGNPHGDPMIDKLKKWILIGLTGLIVGGAVILIVISLIGKFT